ncbi:MAG TPA: cytidine deaminase [Solirubrobacteraceae bacterium]
MRNVEFKARDADPASTLAAALAAGAADSGTLHQVDTYFSVPNGRLKLREQEPGGAWLIPYTRADAAEARVSTYSLVEVADASSLKAALADALGIDVVVAKRRRLLLLDNVRIHLDEVEGLGSFVELEAVVGDDVEAEHVRVASLREALGIPEDAIVAEGYAQLLARAGASAELVAAAQTVAAQAHAPYSQFAVGAALRGDDGAIYVGANVENAAYPQGQCAEASAIGALVAGGAKRITEVAVYADTELIAPCGGCRQRLREFAGDDVKVHLCGPDGVRRTITLGRLLPLAFTERA